MQQAGKRERKRCIAVVELSLSLSSPIQSWAIQEELEIPFLCLPSNFCSKQISLHKSNSLFYHTVQTSFYNRLIQFTEGYKDTSSVIKSSITTYLCKTLNLQYSMQPEFYCFSTSRQLTLIILH